MVISKAKNKQQEFGMMNDEATCSSLIDVVIWPLNSNSSTLPREGLREHKSGFKKLGYAKRFETNGGHPRWAAAVLVAVRAPHGLIAAIALRHLTFVGISSF